MKFSAVMLGATVLAATLGGCAGAGGYYGGPAISYAGYYDDFYGPIYDGYWGRDGFFYYRHGAGDRRFLRGDAAHFRHEAGPGNFHQFGGNFTRGPGMRTPHFAGGGAHGGGGRHR